MSETKVKATKPDTTVETVSEDQKQKVFEFHPEAVKSFIKKWGPAIGAGAATLVGGIFIGSKMNKDADADDDDEMDYDVDYLDADSTESPSDE